MRFLKTLLLALLILSLAVFVVLQYRGHTRKAWKNAALAHLAEDVKDLAWVSKRLKELEQAGPDDSETEGGWFKRDFVLMKDGEWMAFRSICRKEDWRINNLLVGYGSDGRWYYSTYHFCIGASVFRMYGQPDSLVAMAKQYRLLPFDGKSDESLEKTWP
jgi:hypothetical protein